MNPQNRILLLRACSSIRFWTPQAKGEFVSKLLNMAAVRAARALVLRRATTASSSGFAPVIRFERRAFMSSSSSVQGLFSEPSFPVQAKTEDSAVWLEKYARMDQSEMWKIGSFPVQDSNGVPHASQPTNGLSCSQDLWDTQGMLSALSDNLPLRESNGRTADQLLRELDMTYGYFADSVIKKRRKKMNKHKHRKRIKAQRMRTKKN